MEEGKMKLFISDDMAEVACAFNELSVRSDEILCEHTLLDFDLELNPGMTLNAIRQVLLGLKRHICHLKISLCKGFDTDEEEDCVHRNEFFRRLFEVIGKNAAGPKLYEMTISGFIGLSKGMLTSLAPALKLLESLTVRVRSGDILFVLHTFCPKLTRFNLIARGWQGDAANAVIPSWPTLKDLTIRLHSDIDTENGNRLCRFLLMNPQIDGLQMDFPVDNALLDLILKDMRELRMLCVTRETFDGTDEIFKHLAGLTHLRSMMVTTWVFKMCHFKSLLACIETLSTMEKLEIATLVQNYVVKEDGNIVVDNFPATHHEGCDCHSNRTIDFGDRTEAIQLPEDKRSLVIVISMARDLKPADDTLEANILAMFKGAEKFYPNVHKTIIIPEDDRFVFLHAASTL